MLDGSSRRVASAVVAFVLGVAGFVAIAPPASAAPPCDAPANDDRRGELPARFTRIRVGHRRRGRRVDPRLRDADQREPRRDRALQGRHGRDELRASTSTGSATTAATARATSRLSIRRDAPADAAAVPRRTRPVSSTAATGPSPRRGPCPATRCRACTSRKLQRTDATAGREPHRLHRARRRVRLRPAVPDLRHDVAGVQQLRRQQPLHGRARGPRVQGQLQPSVRHTRDTRRGLGVQRRVADDPLDRVQRLRRVVHRGRRHRPFGARCCSSTRCSCRSVTTSTGRDRSARTSKPRGTPACTSRSSAATRSSGRRGGSRASTAPPPRTARSSPTRRPTRPEIQTRPTSGPGRGATRGSGRTTAAGPRTRSTGTIFTVNCCTLHDEGAGARREPALLAEHERRRRDERRRRTLAANSLGYEWDEDLDNGSRPDGSDPDVVDDRVRCTNACTDHGSTYAPGTATHSLTLHRVGNALVFGAGTVQWSWGLDGTHDRGGSTPSLAMQQATVNLFADMGVQPGNLQAGLTPATASTDTTAPTATITAPGRRRHRRSPVTAVTVTGTAADTGGGRVGGVEVSTDDGATWHPANGRENWSYTFTPAAPGPLTLRSARERRQREHRARRAPGRHHGRARRGSDAARARSGTTARRPRSRPTTTDLPIEIGDALHERRRRHDHRAPVLQGRGQHRRAHRPPLERRRNAARARQTFTSETASGWQEAALSTPVPITAGTQYIVSNFSADRATTRSTAATSPAPAYDNAPLHAPAGQRGRAERRLPLRRERLPDDGASTDATTGSTSCSRPRPVRTRRAPLLTTRAPGPERDQRRARRDRARDVRRSARPGHGRRVVVRAARRARTRSCRRGQLRRRDAHRRVHAVGAARAVDRRTRRRCTAARAASPTQPATRSRPTSTWSFTTAAPPPDEGPGGPILVVTSTANPFGRYLGEILQAEGLNEYRTTDITRGERGRARSALRRRRARPDAAERGAGDDVRTYVHRRRQPVAMRPDSRPRRPARHHERRARRCRTATSRSHTGDAARARASRARRSSSTAPPTATRSSGATAVATLFSDATTATSNPAVTLRSVGGNGGQAAAFTYDLARSVVVHPPGQPGVGRAGARRHDADPLRRPVLRRRRRGPATGLGGPRQGRRSRRPTSSSACSPNLVLQMEAGPRAAPALLVPAARREGRRRDDGRRPRRRRHRGPLRRGGRREPARLLGRGLGVRAQHLVRVHRTRRSRPRRPTTYNAQGFEVALHVNTDCATGPRSRSTASTRASSTAGRRSIRRCPRPRRNRTHCIVWSDYDTQPQVELAARHPARHELLLLARQLGRTTGPGFFTGSGFPQRFATAGGDRHRRVPGRDADDRRVGPVVSRRRSTRCSTTRPGRSATTACSPRTCTPTPRRPDGWSAIVASAQAHGVPVVSARQMLDWVDGRNASSFGDDVVHAATCSSFTVDRDARANGLQGMVPATSAPARR